MLQHNPPPRHVFQATHGMCAVVTPRGGPHPAVLTILIGDGLALAACRRHAKYIRAHTASYAAFADRPTRGMLDSSSKPTPRPRASGLREDLQSQLQRLHNLEHELRRTGDNRHHVCADAIAVAIDYLQQAMDALEVASRE